LKKKRNSDKCFNRYHEDIMPCETSKAQRDRYYIIAIIFGLVKFTETKSWMTVALFCGKRQMGVIFFLWANNSFQFHKMENFWKIIVLVNVQQLECTKYH
jgi:hypothetical protein